ncbi:nuclear speckle splicing regulatory protein 1-like [Bombus terrestris]|uniref:Nuclear speckle splicing regulatory protein 1-like n=1 Tax=Bombus terrestris TaxID=30195 RepID=A0A9C6SGL5_BOMTE|nr:nuclear speckle splicing regulatory protein 1-like [Bombus terrestris]
MERNRGKSRWKRRGSDDHWRRLECKNGRRGKADKQESRERKKQAIKRQDNKHGRKNLAKVPGRERLDDNQWKRQRRGGVDIYWGERKLNNRLCDRQPGSDRGDNRHERKKSRENVGRDQRKDKQSSTKEEGKDKEMGHGREGVVRQGVERKEERNEKEDDKVYERKMQQRNVYRGKKGIQIVVQIKKGKA